MDDTRKQTEPDAARGAHYRALRGRFASSQRAFAALVGVSPSYVASWEKGRQEPSVHIGCHMANVLGISLAEVYEGARHVPDQAPAPGAPLRSVPLYAGPVPAGVPLYVGGEAIGELMTTHPRAEWAVRVAGDSMVGAGIEDGCFVVCRHVDGAEDVRNGDPVVALVGSDVTVKRLIRMPDGSCLLRADPPRSEYPDIPCGEDVRLQGVVVDVHTKPGVAAGARREDPPAQVAPPGSDNHATVRMMAEAMARQASANEKQAAAALAMAEAMRLQAETHRLAMERRGGG